MRLQITLLAFLFSVPAAMAQDTTRVLFLGNSYIFYNELPTILTELSESMGHVVVTEQNTPSGASLQGHVNNTESQALIEQGDWDYVVLQEQSQKASLPYDQVTADFFPAVDALVSSIRQHNDCAIPLLYMTWGRENGDAQNCAWWPPVCTYDGMQELLTERYLEAADNTQSWCAPVGMIWEDLLSLTNINLYNPDGSHPSAAGSYLVASTLFVALFGENPELSDYSGPIGPGVSNTIDAAVWDVWELQSNAWMQYDLLDAQFFSQSTPEGCNVQVSTSPYIDSIHMSSEIFNFVLQEGDVITLNFLDSLVAEVLVFSDCADPMSSTQIFYSGANSIREEKNSDASIHPNPASEWLWISQSRVHSEFVLNDSRGTLVQRWSATGSHSVDVSSLPNGLYFAETWTDGRLTNISKIIIER
ncbi:MAG: hypothetical protein CL834_04845 [Crocinitomicaceae bacterium]|nr:hypothetical protein [Crocinitomicaceae bacterium]|tara:strand:- start:486 stop:1739 length:1254 start_codon:yes stop_codon:yes gene_type:complete